MARLAKVGLDRLVLALQSTSILVIGITKLVLLRTTEILS